MLSEALKAAIFQGIPKTIILGPDTLDIHVDYTDKIENISKQLKTTPVVITLKYFGDHRSAEESPVNDQMDVDNDGTDVVFTKGERDLITLSININAVDNQGASFHHRGEIAEAVTNQMILWHMRDLDDVDGIATRERADVSDLSYMMDDSIERRHLDVFLLYELIYQEIQNTIEIINETVDVQE